MTKAEILRYFKNRELDIQNASCALFFLDFVYGAYVNSEIVHGVRFSPVFTYIFSGQMSGYFQIVSKDLVNGVAKKMLLDFKKNPAKVKKIVAEHGHLAEETMALWKKFETEDKGSLTRAGWIGYYRLFIKLTHCWWFYSSIGEDKGEVINREVVPAFARRHGMELCEARRIIMALSHPEEQAVMNLGRLTILKAALYLCEKKLAGKSPELLLRDRKIVALAKEYLAESFWAKSDFYRAVRISPQDFLLDVKKELKSKGYDSLKEEAAALENNFKDIKREKKKILSGLELSAADRKELAFSLLIATWIDLRKKWMMQVVFCTFSFLKEFSGYIGLEYDEFMSYFTVELEDFLKSGKRLPAQEISRRRKGGVFFCMERKKKRPSIFYGRDGKDLFAASQHENRKIKEVKGMVASSGGLNKISGSVVIVFDPDKVEFKKGDILVASMTRVEFVPLMRKAKAVITNEGGIACHAAIVSRELGLPAIIGTKNAMQKLKTGDQVEMDLESGVIKIIK